MRKTVTVLTLLMLGTGLVFARPVLASEETNRGLLQAPVQINNQKDVTENDVSQDSPQQKTEMSVTPTPAEEKEDAEENSEEKEKEELKDESKDGQKDDQKDDLKDDQKVDQKPDLDDGSETTGQIPEKEEETDNTTSPKPEEVSKDQENDRNAEEAEKEVEKAVREDVEEEVEKEVESTSELEELTGFDLLSKDSRDVLIKCEETWGSDVTDERKDIIKSAVELSGVSYSMNYRNMPSVDNPQYLDCSSFVGQAYYRAGVYDESAAWWYTGIFSSKFTQIDSSQLIPGDIAQISWNPGGSGAKEHIGIYIGTVEGTKYYIHCQSHGVFANSYADFRYFGRSPEL